jgi:hypothetical protein
MNVVARPLPPQTERNNHMEPNDGNLRALIRLIPPARALTEQLEKSLHLETYEGTGDFAVRSAEGLRANVARITGDPYVDVLALTVPDAAGDREKVSLALLAVGQLVAYLEGQTGLVSLGGGGGKTGGINIQRAPNVNINGINGLTKEQMDRVLDTTARAMEKGTETAATPQS